MKKKRLRNGIKFYNTVFIVALFLFALMIGRAAQLALMSEIDGTNLKQLASKRTTKTTILPAKRGNIYTTDGEILAQNVSSYTIIAYLDPKRTTNENHPQHVVDKEKTAKELAPILGMSEEEILALLQKEVYQTEFGSKGKGLTEITKEKIESLKLPGIDFIEKQKRYYPKGDFLSYTLGYAKTVIQEEGENAGKEDIVGEMGIEKEYNDILKGQDGYVTYQKDLNGYKIANTKEVRQDAQSGQDIYLTIDYNIQFLVEQALKSVTNRYGFEWLTMMVADAKSGKILAASSTPSFDPNVRDIKNYLDLNVASPYEPGSTMKIFTFMAAMENGVYNGSETYKSGVYTTSDGTEIGDWYRQGWGWITYDRGFTLSSNLAVVHLVNDKMNSKILRQYFKKLGFGSKTGIELPQESSGKIDFKYETEVLNAAFGQGITTTPIQNIQALTSLANDGMLLKPYLIDKIVDPSTGKVTYQGKRKEIEKVASTETVEKMKQLMYDTVNIPGNTGAGYRIPGYNLIGKTGTAQISDESGRGYLSGANQILLSFAGMYPMENPEIIIYASLKRPDAGANRPMFDAVKEVVINVSKYLGHTEAIGEVDPVSTYELPSFINKNVEQVASTLQNKQIPYILIGDGTKVIAQYPSIGTTVTSKDKVFLVTNGANRTLVDMNGWSSKDAQTYLNLLGVKSKLEGNGYVNSQSVGVGTPVTAEMEVVLTLVPKYGT